MGKEDLYTEGYYDGLEVGVKSGFDEGFLSACTALKERLELNKEEIFNLSDTYTYVTSLLDLVIAEHDGMSTGD